MKAALEAWGAESNLFHQGAAKESDDPDDVAATIAKAGVILRRPVGSNGPFREHAELPTDLAEGEGKPRPKRRRANGSKQPTRKLDDQEAGKAALAFEKEEKRRERERRKEEAARAKERARRDKAVTKAQATLDEAKREHNKRIASIEAERAALEKRTQAERARWSQQKRKLQTALRRARE